MIVVARLAGFIGLAGLTRPVLIFEILPDLAPTHAGGLHGKQVSSWDAILHAPSVSQIDLAEAEMLAEPTHNLLIGNVILCS